MFDERMRRAALEIVLPNRTWIGSVSADHPDMTANIVGATSSGESGYGIIRLVGPSISSFLSSMEAHPGIINLTLVQRSDREAIVHFETAEPMLLRASKESGIPIERPVVVSGGVAHVRVTGSADLLSKFTRQLRQRGIDFEVTPLDDEQQLEQVLSDRQRELVRIAIDRGYYDTPRACTLTELAEELDIAKSTCSEILHRAEGAIIKHVADELRSIEGDHVDMTPPTRSRQ